MRHIDAYRILSETLAHSVMLSGTACATVPSQLMLLLSQVVQQQHKVWELIRHSAASARAVWCLVCHKALWLQCALLTVACCMCVNGHTADGVCLGWRARLAIADSQPLTIRTKWASRIIHTSMMSNPILPNCCYSTAYWP
jgi:hypothetical protein